MNFHFPICEIYRILVKDHNVAADNQQLYINSDFSYRSQFMKCRTCYVKFFLPFKSAIGVSHENPQGVGFLFTSVF